MQYVDYQITSLTPTFTGDQDRKAGELIASGLIGSLRYQYWLLKAMELWAEKNNDEWLNLPQEYDQGIEQNWKNELEKGAKLAAQLKKAGSVVQFFGATGWKRLVRIELLDASQIAGSESKSAVRNEACLWNFTLRFRIDRQVKLSELKDLGGPLTDPLGEIQRLMAFVHHYGWLGAAPQNGFGWVSVKDIDQDSALDIPLVPLDNPVFLSKDLVLTPAELDGIKYRLRWFYNRKAAASTGRLRGRYKESASNLGNASLPIGHEIRRFVRYLAQHNYKLVTDPSITTTDPHLQWWGHPSTVASPTINEIDGRNPTVVDKLFGFFGRNISQASHVHISHPVPDEGNFKIRLRYTARPNQGNLFSPNDVLDWCESVIRCQTPSGNLF